MSMLTPRWQDAAEIALRRALDMRDIDLIRYQHGYDIIRDRIVFRFVYRGWFKGDAQFEINGYESDPLHAMLSAVEEWAETYLEAHPSAV